LHVVVLLPPRTTIIPKKNYKADFEREEHKRSPQDSRASSSKVRNPIFGNNSKLELSVTLRPATRVPRESSHEGSSWRTSNEDDVHMAGSEPVPRWKTCCKFSSIT